jgi:hypothetical protein
VEEFQYVLAAILQVGIKFLEMFVVILTLDPSLMETVDVPDALMDVWLVVVLQFVSLVTLLEVMYLLEPFVVMEMLGNTQMELEVVELVQI